MGQRPLCITWELFREAHFVNFPIVWDTSSIKELILSSLLIFRVHGTLQMVLASTTKLLKTYKMSNGRICSSQGECIMIKGLIQEEDIRQSVSSVQLLSHVQLFVTPCTIAHQASLSITNTWSLLKLMSIELVMPSNHPILWHLLLLLPLIFPSIRIFSNESALIIRWPKY